MSALLLPSPYPIVLVILKWTTLLTLGWTAHWLLRERHSRWRLILWRGILCFGLVVPLLCVFPIRVLTIPIPVGFPPTTHVADVVSLEATSNPSTKDESAAHSLDKPAAANTIVRSSHPFSSHTSPERWSWKLCLLMIWVVGAVVAGLRLVLIQFQLSRLRKEASLTSPDLQKVVEEIQARLGIQGTINVRVSDSVSSPFVCGLFKPMVMLPERLSQTLSSGQIFALLAHELAHFRQHDLVWCIGWRWMKAICWFHPLVWRVPSAHNLACEEEADRVASGQLEDWEDCGFYAQLLSQLALRVLGLPDVETKLTVNGTSQIARRLQHLTHGSGGAWSRKRSLAAFGLAGVLFLVAAGCEFSRVNPADSKLPAGTEFKEVLVTVQDEDGKPIEGATVKPTGFRVKGRHQADAYNWKSWNSKGFGLPEKVTTDGDGKAYLKYPVMGIPEEKEYTGELIFSVTHPEYSIVVTQGYPVDGTNGPIRMTRGIPLEVSGYFDSDHQPVAELVPNLNEDWVRTEVWQKKENGTYAFQKLSPGGHLIQLMGRLPSGEIVYSESFPFTAEKGKQYNFGLEMKPGIRLEGRLDDHVPRPIQNGRVLISVRPKEFPAFLVPEDFGYLTKKYGCDYFWHSYRPIAADGTFVFESIPPGEVDVAVHGDGFISKSIGQVQNRINDALVKGPVIGIPQPFPLVAPLTTIEVVTELTATLVVTTKTESGKPVEGATVYLNPNILRMNGIFGWMNDSSEEPFRTMAPLRPAYSGSTDKSGAVVIRNLPAITRGLQIEHPQFEVPLQEPKGWRNRYVRIKLSPGMTTNMVLTLEPKGKEFIGTAD